MRLNLEVILDTLSKAIAAMLACRHGRAPLVEGKAFCPDCGTGLIYTWQVIRCAGCCQRRPCQYGYQGITPEQNCCLSCGCQAYEVIALENPAYYQLRYALLVCETESVRSPRSFRIEWSTLAFATPAQLTGSLASW